jgi:hypothetical protein
VVGADVERVEVQPLGLELGAFGDLVAHPDEDVGDPVGEAGQRVPRAAGRAVPGQRDVDPLLGQHPGVPLLLQDGEPRGVGLGDGHPGRVDPLPGVRARRGGQRAELAAGQQHRGAVTEVRRPDGGQRLQVGGSGEGVDRGADGGVERLRRQRSDLLGVVGVVGARHGSPFCPAPQPGRPRAPDRPMSDGRGQSPPPDDDAGRGPEDQELGWPR